MMKVTRRDVSRFGVIGSSDAQRAIWGYNLIQGERGWPNTAVDKYNGRDILTWEDNIGFQPWVDFNSSLGAFPDTDSLWVMIAIRGADAPTAELTSEQTTALTNVVANARTLIDAAGLRIPDIVVSGLAERDESTVPLSSDGAGEFGREVSWKLAYWGVRNGICSRMGPELPPVTERLIIDPISDIHYNKLGQVEAGKILDKFFFGKK